MRRNVWTVLCLALATWVAPFRPASAQAPRGGGRPAPRTDTAARPAAAQPTPAIDPTGQRMQQLLGVWAEHSEQLKSLDVNIVRIDRSAAWGDQEYLGRAMFKAPNRAFLDFQKVVDPKANPKKTIPHERIICTGTEVWQYSSDAKQIFIYKLGKQAQQRALQEGPLPFLFNFRADEAKKRYQMKLVHQDAQWYIIDVVPLLKIDKECFNIARIQLDSTTFLPSKIYLVDPEGKGRKEFQISNIVPNKAVMDVNFEGKKIPRWTVHVNEEEPESGAQQAGRPDQGGTPRRPALRQQAAPRQAQQKRSFFGGN